MYGVVISGIPTGLTELKRGAPDDPVLPDTDSDAANKKPKAEPAADAAADMRQFSAAAARERFDKAAEKAKAAVKVVASAPVPKCDPPQQHVYADGCKWFGVLRDGQREGPGILTYPCGMKFTCEWVKGVAKGKGRMVSPTGDTWAGTWDGKRPVGKVTHCKPSRRGEVAIGEYLDKFRHGEWELTWSGATEPNHPLKATMTYDKGVWSGPGTMTFVDGTTFDGLFSNNLRHGPGTLTGPNNVRWVHGTWENGKLEGVAIMTHADGSTRNVFFLNDCVNVAATARIERRAERLKRTCIGCSFVASDGTQCHPSQKYHMECGGCLDPNREEADPLVSSDEEDADP